VPTGPLIFEGTYSNVHIGEWKGSKVSLICAFIIRPANTLNTVLGGHQGRSRSWAFIYNETGKYLYSYFLFRVMDMAYLFIYFSDSIEKSKYGQLSATIISFHFMDTAKGSANMVYLSRQ
jgi:hypothetical protein